MQTSSIDINLNGGTSDEAFNLAVHHLQLAASLFESIAPGEFEALSSNVKHEEYYHLFHAMFGAAAAEFKTEEWMRQLKIAAADELAEFDDDDPVGNSIWERYSLSLRSGLGAAGWSEERVDDADGDLGASIHQWRQDIAERAA